MHKEQRGPPKQIVVFGVHIGWGSIGPSVPLTIVDAVHPLSMPLRMLVFFVCLFVVCPERSRCVVETMSRNGRKFFF